MTREGVMIANLEQIAAGNIEVTRGKFKDYSRKEMMEMAQYALNPTKTEITDGPREEDNKG